MRELRLGLVLAFLALPIALPVAGGLARSHAFGAFELADAPRSLAGLASTGDSELEERVLREIEPSAYLMRSFSDGHTQALAYVAFYTGFDSSGAHDPQVCYPSQGYDIGEIHNLMVELGDGSRLWSKVFRARRGADEEIVLHWFQPLGPSPSPPHFEPWVRMLQAFRGRNAYAFVRASVEIGAGGAAAAEQRALRMAAELAPWSRRVRARAHSLPDAASVREEAAQPRAQEGGERHGQALPGCRETLKQSTGGIGRGRAGEHVATG